MTEHCSSGVIAGNTSCKGLRSSFYYLKKRERERESKKKRKKKRKEKVKRGKEEKRKFVLEEKTQINTVTKEGLAQD